MTGLITRLSRHKKEFIIAIGVVVSSNANKFRSSVVGMVNASIHQSVHLDTNETYFRKVVRTENDLVTIADAFYFLDNSKRELIKES